MSTNLATGTPVAESQNDVQNVKIRKASTSSLNTNTAQSKPAKQSVSNSNENNKAKTSQKRRNRKKNNGKQTADQQNRLIQDLPKLMDNIVDKPENICVQKTETKYTHTVFGGMSREQFNKQQTELSVNNSASLMNNKSQSKPVNITNTGNKSNENLNGKKQNLQHTVKVTSSKSVIVSILDHGQNQATYTSDESTSLKNTFSSSLNEHEKLLMMNGLMNQKNEVNKIEQMQKFELELEKNYVFRMKKVS